MQKLYLFDPNTEIAVECPHKNDDSDKPTYCWDLREAIQLLVNTVAEKTEVPVMQILYGSQDSFQIIAVDSDSISEGTKIYPLKGFDYGDSKNHSPE
jgi:hypothetical protein